MGASPYSKAHDRVFDFSGLVPDYGLEFAEKTGTTFIAVAGNLVAARAERRRLMHFLRWLATSSETTMALRMRNGQHIDQREFIRVALLYQQEVIFAEIQITRKGRGSHRFGIIEKFGAAGVFPYVRFSRTVDRRQRRIRNPRPSLDEAVDIKANTKKIMDATAAASRYRDIVIDTGKDAIAFAQTLAVERARRPDLAESLPEAIRILCEERLIEIRKAASAVFKAWREKYEDGRRLIAHADYSGEQIFEMLKEERANGIQTGPWNRLVASLFPPAEPRRALANLLALLEAKFHGICPNGTTGEWRQFWIATYRKVGGTRAVHEYFCPPRLVVSAIMFLYLCESGTNSDVAVQMKPNAIRPSRRPRNLIVTGRKARARNKAIFSELPIKKTAVDCTSAAEALLFYTEVGRPLRAGHKDTPLFIHVSHNALKEMNDWHLREDLLKIAATSERLASLKRFPTMIRSTVLLAMQLRHPTSLDVVQIFAQHEQDTTTMGFVGKLPYRMILEQRMQRFVNTIEVVISEEDTWKEMGRTTASWQDAIHEAQRTGLGVWCKDPRAGTQPDFPKGTTCHAVDRCLNCSKIMVVADRDSVADMIVWAKALEQAAPSWLEDRTERWEQHWVPWQAFFQVVLNEKMTRGKLAVIKKAAEAEAAKRMTSPTFRLPQPW